MSPQAALVHSSLSELCVGLPAKADAGSVAGLLVPVAVRDVDVLSSPRNQQCAENPTQARGDEPLSRVLGDISALSRNGAGNG